MRRATRLVIKVTKPSVPGMFCLGDIFKLIVDGLDQKNRQLVQTLVLNP